MSAENSKDALRRTPGERVNSERSRGFKSPLSANESPSLGLNRLTCRISPRLGANAPPIGTGEGLTCRIMPRHFDFLSVGEEFGADAPLFGERTHATNLRISRAMQRTPLVGELPSIPRNHRCDRTYVPGLLNAQNGLLRAPFEWDLYVPGDRFRRQGGRLLALHNGLNDMGCQESQALISSNQRCARTTAFNSDGSTVAAEGS